MEEMKKEFREEKVIYDEQKHSHDSQIAQLIKESESQIAQLLNDHNKLKKELNDL